MLDFELAAGAQGTALARSLLERRPAKVGPFRAMAARSSRVDTDSWLREE